MSAPDFPLSAGDRLVPVQISPCVGGLVRTWSETGSTLWSVPDDGWLRGVQATGKIGRTVREERRFREAALLAESESESGAGSGSGRLLVQARFPLPSTDGRGLTMEAQLVPLAAERRPSRATFEDFRELIVRAVQHCAATDEFLIVERGGWDAPREPFCLFAVLPEADAAAARGEADGAAAHQESDGAEGERAVSVVETAPAPSGSELWAPWIDETNPTHSMSAPASPETIAVAPMLMIEAISRWGLDPWDLALTFGQR